MMPGERFGDTVDLTVDGAVARLTIDVPPLNLLATPVLHALRGAVAAVAARDDLRVLVVTGAGERAFVAGVDVREMRAFDRASARAFISLLHGAMADLRRLPIPVIARINGYAIGGGCELACACDLRIAAEHAQFGMPEVRVGIPSVIEAALIPHLVGGTRAMELLMLGERIDAPTALAWGLVNRVVPAAELDAAVEAMAGALLRCGPRALAAQKRLVYAWLEVPLTRAFELGIEAFADAYATDEPREAMDAFREKRPPRWSG